MFTVNPYCIILTQGLRARGLWHFGLRSEINTQAQSIGLRKNSSMLCRSYFTVFTPCKSKLLNSLSGKLRLLDKLTSNVKSPICCNVNVTAVRMSHHDKGGTEQTGARLDGLTCKFIHSLNLGRGGLRSKLLRTGRTLMISANSELLTLTLTAS